MKKMIDATTWEQVLAELASIPETLFLIEELLNEGRMTNHSMMEAVAACQFHLERIHDDLSELRYKQQDGGLLIYPREQMKEG